MLVSVKSLIRQADCEQPLIFHLPQAELGEIFPSVRAAGDLCFDGMLKHLERGRLKLGGRLRLPLETPCARCLAPCRLELEEELNLLLIPERERASREGQMWEAWGAEEEAYEEDAYYEGEAFDPQPPLLAALIQRLPMRQFCRPDCRGLCPQCGGDLNEGPCACAVGAEDESSPFAKLKKLL